jgi:1-deoxy-D-xylulose-5-phosphate reductoisomerase
MAGSHLKNISLIGATGSVGRQTLEVVADHPEVLKVVAMASGKNNLHDFAEKIKEFQPELVSVPTPESASELKQLLGKEIGKVSIMWGDEGIEAVATHPNAETLVTAVVGFKGLKPTTAAIRLGRTIALANKETLVAAGGVIMPMVKQYGAKIVPVDSEHAAIHQCLRGYSASDLTCIWLTASGGPFRKWSLAEIQKATVEDALEHPNWSMGNKITIDSATMMNKGLEVIEARWLFEIEPDNIRIVIHPQSILHSAVEFKDGSIVGQLGVPDMRMPIHYALFYPERVASSTLPRLNLAQMSQLSFEEPDPVRFPCLRIASQLASEDSTRPSVLNAANEIVVEAFLKRRITFGQIPAMILSVLEKHKAVSKPGLDDILEADRWARQEAENLLQTAS